MSFEPSPIGEDDLQAYVDDRLSPLRRADMDAFFAQHPDLAKRVADEIEHRRLLRERLGSKLAEPIPARLRLANIRAGRTARWLNRARSMAASAMLIAVGGIGGWFLRYPPDIDSSNPSVSVRADAVAAYRTFVVEVAHPVEVRATEETHLLQWLSKRLGRPLNAPDLSRYGFRLMGGRILPAENSAAAMLMYDNDSGTRLTVYIRAGEGGETAFRFQKDGDVATFSWLDQGFGFAVSAATDRDQLLPVAEAVYRSLDIGSKAKPLSGG